VSVQIGVAVSSGVADGVVDGAAAAEGDAGDDVESGVPAGAGLVADVQATTRRATTIVVVNREGEGRISMSSRRSVPVTFGGAACYFDRQRGHASAPCRREPGRAGRGIGLIIATRYRSDIAPFECLASPIDRGRATRRRRVGRRMGPADRG
jgi:hypothetical protein